MREFDERSITEAVVERFQGTPDPRLKAVMTSLVRHLHDFVRDVELTFDEWSYAIDFLTRTGQMCSATRQEFILLSDTLGVSMLVDAINHRTPEGATQTTVLGPFYVQTRRAAARRRRVGRPAGRAAVRRGLSRRGGRGAARERRRGHLAVRRRGLLRRPAPRGRGADAKGAVAAPARKAASRSGPSCQSSTRFRKTVAVGEMLRATNRHPNRPAHAQLHDLGAGLRDPDHARLRQGQLLPRQ